MEGERRLMPARKRYGVQLVFPATVAQKEFCANEAEKRGITLSGYMRGLIDAEIERRKLLNANLAQEPDKQN